MPGQVIESKLEDACDIKEKIDSKSKQGFQGENTPELLLSPRAIFSGSNL